MTYETDEEKVEAIKKWWKENGLSVAAGIVLGVAAIWGWRYWVEYREQTAAQASAIFSELLVSVDRGQLDEARIQSQRLRVDYGSTPYAALGQLALARALHAGGDAAGAGAALGEAIAQAPDPALARIAALRLARLQLDQGQLDAAAATLAAHDDGQAFAGDFAVARGDLALARGDQAAARAAYETALASGAGLSELVRLKIDNLPAPAAPPQ